MSRQTSSTGALTPTRDYRHGQTFARIGRVNRGVGRRVVPAKKSRIAWSSMRSSTLSISSCGMKVLTQLERLAWHAALAENA